MAREGQGYPCYQHAMMLMMMMSTLYSASDAVSSGSCPIQFKFLMLSVAHCTVLLGLGNFCLFLSSVADFLNTGVRAPTSAKRAFDDPREE